MSDARCPFAERLIAWHHVSRHVQGGRPPPQSPPPPMLPGPAREAGMTPADSDLGRLAAAAASGGTIRRRRHYPAEIRRPHGPRDAELQHLTAAWSQDDASSVLGSTFFQPMETRIMQVALTFTVNLLCLQRYPTKPADEFRCSTSRPPSRRGERNRQSDRAREPESATHRARAHASHPTALPPVSPGQRRNACVPKRVTTPSPPKYRQRVADQCGVWQTTVAKAALPLLSPRQ
jgi:hypothetical protein